MFRWFVEIGEPDCSTTAFDLAKDKRAYIAAVEVRCLPAVLWESSKVDGVGLDRFGVPLRLALQAAFDAKVWRPRARGRPWRRLFRAARLLGCSASAQYGALSVRGACGGRRLGGGSKAGRLVQTELKPVLQPYGADRFFSLCFEDVVLRAELWCLLQLLHTSCCSLRRRRIGRK